MNKTAQISQQQRAINENQKLGSFYDRVVEYGPGIGCCAAGAAVVYLFNAPIVGAIGISIGGILICKRLFARSVAVLNPVLNPLMKNLEEIKSSHGLDAVAESIESFVEAYDSTSALNQVAIIKKMTSMLYDEVKEDAMKALKAINRLISKSSLDEVKNFEAFINGVVAFFEKVASEDAEKDKSDVLLESIDQLKRFLVDINAAEIGNNKQQINLSKLYASLDNLILTGYHSPYCMSLIFKIKEKLPLLTSEKLVLSLKNMESRNPSTRHTALCELGKAYETAPESQVDIIKAMIKMLNDNLGDVRNGDQALGQIQKLVIDGKLNDATKLQAFIDGLADYCKNPGEMVWENLFVENGNKEVLNGVIEVLLGQFKEEYQTEIKGLTICLTPLKESLGELNKSIPDNDLTLNLKERIQRLQNSFSK